VTDYVPHPRRRNFWLLANGSIVQEPKMEQSPAGRRVRIWGHEETVRRDDRDTILYRWIASVARKRETAPVYKLVGDPSSSDPEELKQILDRQVGVVDPVEHFQPYSRNGDTAVARWLFKHPVLPVYGKVELGMRVKRGTPYVESTITFAPMCERDAQGFSSWRHTNSTSWDGAIADHMVPDHLVGDCNRILAANDLPMGTESYPNGEAAMAEALRRYRIFDALTELWVPDLSRSKRPQAGEHTGVASERRLVFHSACQPESYLGEMVEFIDSLEPASRLVELWGEIAALLQQRGVQFPNTNLHETLAILHSNPRRPVGLKPYVHQDGDIEEDRDHKVTIDLYDGIVHVACTKRTTKTDEDILAYEIAKERAAITGETNLMEAFLSTITDYRRTEDVDRVVRAARHT
jgi:hypothetical protein